MVRRIQVLLLVFLLFLLSSTKILAADFKSDYQVEYFLGKTDSITTAKVIFTINITNLRSDVYVKKFSIAFPKNYVISQITAADDKGVVDPKIINEYLNIPKLNPVLFEYYNPNLLKTIALCLNPVVVAPIIRFVSGLQ